MIPIELIPMHASAVLERTLDQELVLVLPARGQVKVLNEVGARLWALVDGSRTVREIIELICQEYHVEASQAETDTCQFIQLLVDRELIILSAPGAARP